MCELINRARLLAKQHGLEVNAINCPPDRQALCTGAECLMAGLGFEDLSTDTSDANNAGQENMNKFYEKIKSHFRIIGKLNV